MMLTSLLALALSLPSTNTMSMSRTRVSVGHNTLISLDNAMSYTGNVSISSDTTGSVQFNINVDNNYNEYFVLHYHVDFTNNYCYFSCENWTFNTYNVNGFCYFTLVDLFGMNIVSWDCSNGILGLPDGYPGEAFIGDSDVINVDLTNYSALKLYIDVYLYLLTDFDISEYTNDSYGEGYTNGYNQGQQDGYQQGTTDGYQDGRTDGYNDGYNTGKTDGYNLGYNTALGTHSFSFTNLFASISDTPILMIRRLFGFEIFGTSVLAIFMSLFTALIVIKVIKRLI